MDVTDLIGQRINNIVWLSIMTLVFTCLSAIPVGITSGRHNDTLRDQLNTGYTYVGFATPLFIFALIALWIFGFNLCWFPTGGRVTPGLARGTLDFYISRLYHLILPALSMALISTVCTVQYL